MRLIEDAALRALVRAAPEARLQALATMTYADLLAFDADFETWAHPAQRPPAGEGWRTWLLMGGRGFGKTRAGAEWIQRLATQRGRPVRIALVGASEADVRSVMIEGESGILAVGAAAGRVPTWQPSLRELRWPGGSIAGVYSAEAPDGLRGPQFDFAWCDELAKWPRGPETWTNLQLALRCGERPRALVTTTPRGVPLLTDIRDDPRTVTTNGATRDNPHLSAAFLEVVTRTYGGTWQGRQELDGELIGEIEGSLFPRAMLEAARRPAAGCAMARIVVGVDPPATSAGACGIVVAGLGTDGRAAVLADASVAGARPDGWARAVAAAARAWGADRVVAERNQGGDMVRSVLEAADAALPVRLVHASRGKSVRAEPVATWFAGGRAILAGRFPALEDELAGLIAGGGYEGPGTSPDRADAMVWAMTELIDRARSGGGPRVMVL